MWTELGWEEGEETNRGAGSIRWCVSKAGMVSASFSLGGCAGSWWTPREEGAAW